MSLTYYTRVALDHAFEVQACSWLQGTLPWCDKRLNLMLTGLGIPFAVCRGIQEVGCTLVVSGTPSRCLHSGVVRTCVWWVENGCRYLPLPVTVSMCLSVCVLGRGGGG
jgi:hypothetical protein